MSNTNGNSGRQTTAGGGTAAWLRRMPTHWRILLGSQALFTAAAFGYRFKIVRKRRQELAQLQQLQENPLVAAPGILDGVMIADQVGKD